MPWYVPVLGAAFAIVIAKQVFGGLGDNFVNPALAGRAFLLASFPVAMTTFPAVADAVSSATPLSSEFAGTVDYAQAFLGRIGGSIGEVSKLALLAGAAYLLVRRVIDWRVPVSYLGTLAVLNLAFGEPVLDSVLLGGTVLGAFFMATDYVTSPGARLGQGALRHRHRRDQLRHPAVGRLSRGRDVRHTPDEHRVPAPGARDAAAQVRGGEAPCVRLQRWPFGSSSS